MKLPFNFIQVYIGVKTANMVSKNTYIGLKIGQFYIKIALNLGTIKKGHKTG